MRTGRLELLTAVKIGGRPDINIRDSPVNLLQRDREIADSLSQVRERHL